MAYATIVELEWTPTFTREQFERAGGGEGELPKGCLGRFVGADDTGARIVEIWESADHARAHAEASAPKPARADAPRPARSHGFPLSTYRWAGPT